MYMHRTGILGSFDGSDGVWYDIYDMGSKTFYDTAFIDDSFTLIYVGKRVRLAFNNKFFDIQNASSKTGIPLLERNACFILIKWDSLR